MAGEGGDEHIDKLRHSQSHCVQQVGLVQDSKETQKRRQEMVERVKGFSLSTVESKVKILGSSPRPGLVGVPLAMTAGIEMRA